jgi:non-specific serine/threonine protein kinase
MTTSVESSSTATGGATAAKRRVGGYTLLQLLGKSAVAMVWEAQATEQNTQNQTHQSQPVLIYMPRQPLTFAQEVEVWRQTIGRIARIEHPNLLKVLAHGADGQWPYMVLEHPKEETLGAYLFGSSHGEAAAQWPPLETSVQWAQNAASALAALHDAGVVHTDVGYHTLWIGAGSGQVRLLPPVNVVSTQQVQAVDRDLVMVGLLLHTLLLHRSALEQADFSLAAPLIDIEIVRLPWTTPRPVPEPLRAIVNRATDHHLSRRFVSARGLLRALQGWAQADGDVGAISQLLNHLPHAGVMPAMPGLSNRLTRLVSAETPIDTMVEVIAEDPALAFELLRLANMAGARSPEEGMVFSLSRAIQLLGLNGLRRAAASLKPWPGVLGLDRCAPLREEVVRLRAIAYTAAQLAPPGLKKEEPLMAAFLQGLGKILVLYHFPEEAQQIAALREGGMNAVSAACAVLGTDEESLAMAVVKQWGWRDEVLSMVCEYRVERASSRLEHFEWLRCMGSAAAETVHFLAQPPAAESHSQSQSAAGAGGERSPAKKGLPGIALRYHRLLGLSAQELYDGAAAATERQAPLLRAERGG